eukprot:1225126-Prymnesium_polylepis.1
MPAAAAIVAACEIMQILPPPAAAAAAAFGGLFYRSVGIDRKMACEKRERGRWYAASPWVTHNPTIPYPTR